MDLWILGALAGLVATAAMTLIELAARARWGLEGLLDWQINQATLARLTKRPSEALVLPALGFHFLHGLLGGLVFVLLLPLLPPGWPLLALGLGYGALLYIVTLFAVEPVTGKAAASGPHGAPAVAVALLTHLAYGAVLAALLLGA